MQDTFNSYQYNDLETRENDPYSKIKYRIIVDYLKKNGRTDMRILNAGCGSGDLSLLLAQAGFKVIGYDPGAKYIELANKNAANSGVKDCEFRIGGIEDMPLSEQYDCVITTDVLEHIESDFTAMKKLAEVTKTGGILINVVPALESLYGYHDELIGHYRRYTKRTLKRLIESPKNTNVILMRFYGLSLVPVCLLFSRLLRKQYPMETGKPSTKTKVLNAILNFILNVEAMLPLPLGISLICVAKKV